jgi:hypothetical protein
MVGSQELFFEFGPICLKVLKVVHYCGHHPCKTQVGLTAIDAGHLWSPYKTQIEPMAIDASHP